ncbi:MAG: flagellar hook protein FlgE [Mariprofundaceae bacterium]|nr:flagellar hook protein FlgE [Mariprofundaceae bacterium]
MMGIYNALFTGASGLKAFGESVRVIGDNIANVNSLGFKSQNMQFSSVLSQTIGVTKANIANQVGGGVKIGQIAQDNRQGSVQNTTNPTDMAINGNGLFALKDPASGQTFYTRAGSFILDKNSNLIDGQGNVVQGWATNTTGLATGNITNITFANSSAQAQATTKVTAGVTIDATAPVVNAPAFDPADPTTYSYKTQVNAYDSLGSVHPVNIYYSKTAANQWSWHAGASSVDLIGGGVTPESLVVGPNAYNVANPALPPGVGGVGQPGVQITKGTKFNVDVTIDGVALAAGTAVAVGTKTAAGGIVATPTPAQAALTLQVTRGNVMTPVAVGTANSQSLAFGNTGELTVERSPLVNFQWKSAVASTIQFNFGAATTTDSTGITGTGFDGTVQMAGSFATSKMTTDGFASGFLDKLDTDSTGTIYGVFTNGQRRPMFQVALAKFSNDAVLTKVGNNLQQQTIASGAPILEKPSNGGMGSITPFGLEQSNVDLGTEFVKLIVSQRGYEANSKTILTTDQMLSSLMQLKR